MASAFDLELALDRFEARFAAELVSHLRVAADAYARGTSGPALPALAAAELQVARRALAIGELRLRALRVIRLVAPIVIEADPAVARARAAPPSWDGLRVLGAARDAVAVSRFGVRHRALLLALAGAHQVMTGHADPVPPVPAGWREPDGVIIDDAAIHEAWNRLGARDGFGALSIARSGTAHPRMFAIERGVQGTIVVPAVVDTPAKRFSVLHELGHALLWLSPIAKEIEWPRAIDEACASRTARRMEMPGVLHRDWYHPAAAEARARRTQIAAVLDELETSGAEQTQPPPSALWHDPWSQPAYLVAERLADAVPPDLGGGELAHHFALGARAIDASCTL